MSKAIAAAALLVAILAPTLAEAAHRQARPAIEGRSAYRRAAPPSRCAFITTDRVRDNRFWDPGCRRWGSGVRPGVGENSGILEGQ